MNPTPAVFHRSTRTSVALNTDPATGQRTQTLRTSALEMVWVGEDLCIRYVASQATLDPDRARRSPGRWRGK
ncbi:hypothetical protein [Acidovorax sp. LjRoot117]|uniref:hypothetical protein n=1 Tax=Acidovorax sp. LjRoot117 TaxID=3342255 RepID=UPI003ED011FC